MVPGASATWCSSDSLWSRDLLVGPVVHVLLQALIPDVTGVFLINVSHVIRSEHLHACVHQLASPVGLKRLFE